MSENSILFAYNDNIIYNVALHTKSVDVEKYSVEISSQENLLPHHSYGYLQKYLEIDVGQENMFFIETKLETALHFKGKIQ